LIRLSWSNWLRKTIFAAGRPQDVLGGVQAGQLGAEADVEHQTRPA
jgi:hypothetical protein